MMNNLFSISPNPALNINKMIHHNTMLIIYPNTSSNLLNNPTTTDNTTKDNTENTAAKPNRYESQASMFFAP